MPSVKRLASAAVAVAFLAACGGTSPPAAVAKPSPSAVAVVTTAPQAPPGSDTFLADFRRAGLGVRDLQATPDDDLLAVGRSVCNGLTRGLVPEQVESVLQRQPEDPPTSVQAHEIVVSARRNLCPAT